MKPGDIVKNKHKEEYARVVYSSFGISLHFITEHEGAPVLAKTLGGHPSEYEADWVVVRNLPNDWKIGDHNCPVKI